MHIVCVYKIVRVRKPLMFHFFVMFWTHILHSRCPSIWLRSIFNGTFRKYFQWKPEGSSKTEIVVLRPNKIAARHYLHYDFLPTYSHVENNSTVFFRSLLFAKFQAKGQQQCTAHFYDSWKRDGGINASNNKQGRPVGAISTKVKNGREFHIIQVVTQMDRQMF